MLDRKYSTLVSFLVASEITASEFLSSDITVASLVFGSHDNRVGPTPASSDGERLEKGRTSKIRDERDERDERRVSDGELGVAEA